MILQNCVAIVTGGASGLGEATVRMIVSNGGKACIADVNDEKGKKIESELGARAVFVKTDITDEEQVKKAIDVTVDKYGKLNAAINIAGIQLPKRVLTKSGPSPLADFQKVININLIGTFNVLRLAADVIAKNEPGEDEERGVIVNTSSIASYGGQIGQASYSSSKGAINSMILPITRELARVGIRVMGIAPGLFSTPIYHNVAKDALDELIATLVFPKRMGRPEEYANLVKFILENVMLNGSVIRLDGGLYF